MSTGLDAAQRRRLLAHPDGWIALGFGSGLVPRAPGTAGSLAALLPWLALRQLPWPQYLAVLLLAFALGVWACERAGRRIGLHDPGAFVIDEFVGQWVALIPALLAPWWAVAAGFVLFRLFDIAKPWPVRWADRRVGGGLGVMLDDLLAGALAALALALLLMIRGRLYG
ncbi:MAG: phosphatidylglycerophosphatase A [Xanthomonadaceae bacterium]|nr:phosphatidylglycerophosphatase A [Xanthomonadaceae bacterium]MDE2178449.1 phosphatidylglycerophosphatase A [Xanthomonadaceae bacterium]